MTVHQLSVFIENKSGTLVQVLKSFKEAGIQLIALTIADTAEYGICRILCNNPSMAYDLLKKNGIAVSTCDVFALKLEDEPGAAADAIELFANEGINIVYMYSLLLGGKCILIFRTDDAQKAKEVIDANHLNIIQETELSQLH